jgi:hypothetical protein
LKIKHISSYYNELNSVITSEPLQKYYIYIYLIYKGIWIIHILDKGPLWPSSYGSWIYNSLCNQCLSPLKLWVRIQIRVKCTTLCVKVCQWLAIGQWFSPGPPVSSTNKTDRHDITEILLKVALNTIKSNQSKPYSRYLKPFSYVKSKITLVSCT